MSIWWEVVIVGNDDSVIPKNVFLRSGGVGADIFAEASEFIVL